MNNTINAMVSHGRGTLQTEIGHWLDHLDDKYCVLVDEFSLSDIRETAEHFYKLGVRNQIGLTEEDLKTIEVALRDSGFGGTPQGIRNRALYEKLGFKKE